MQKIFMKMSVKPGKEAEYVRKHRLLMLRAETDDCTATSEEIRLCEETWKVHQDAGIRNYSIFMMGTDLYAFFEADDYQKTLDQITKSEAGQRWQKYMEGLLEQKDGIPVMEICEAPIFHMD